MGSGERSTGQNIFMTRSHDFQVLKGIKSTFPPQKFHIDLDARKFPYFKFLHLFQSIIFGYPVVHFWGKSLSWCVHVVSSVFACQEMENLFAELESYGDYDARWECGRPKVNIHTHS